MCGKIERAALEMENDDETMDSFAYGVLGSSRPALGIIIARSLLPIVRQRDAVHLSTHPQARDRLELSPDDAFSDIMDERFARTADASGVDAEEFRLANQKLQEKGREVRELKESLARLRREIDRRETKTKSKEASPAPAPAVTDPRTTQELREKVALLKATLKERHQQRADLRRELEKVQTDLETLRQTASASRTPPASRPPPRPTTTANLPRSTATSPCA